jgi:chaperone modulatory protein CbpM
MFRNREFLLRAQLDDSSLEAWIEAGWLVPQRSGPEPVFSELDLARTWLIRDLRDSLGVNDEGIGVALGLLDQLHGLRHALRQLSGTLQTLPDPLRQEILMQLRTATGEDPAAGLGSGEPSTGR